MGNTAGDSFFAYAFAVFVSSARETSGSNALSAPLLVSLAISVLFIWTILNFIRVEDIGWIYNMASVLQIGTILALSIVILSTAPHLNSLSFVFFDYNNSTGFTQEYYVVMLSFLYPLFGFVGYDSPAHLAEETKSSRKVSSMGIIYTVLGCGITGFLVLLALLFGLQDITQAIEGPSGNAAVEIIQQTAGRYVASVFSWILVINMFFTGMSSVTVTSRILYVLCRDKASHYAEPLATVHPHYRSPINASIFLFLIQFLLLLIPLFSARGVVAFYSVLSICVVGLQISYLIPVVLKVLIFINPEENSKMLARLQNSYISLGVFSLPLGILASIWLFFTTLLLLLPTNYPITGATMNYTSVVLIITIIVGIINWEYNSKHTFTGPPRSFDIDDNENNENTNDTHATLVPTRELEPLIRGR